ncbi:MAG: hypothetical protein WC332_01660 [Clostridia bacterium]
MPNKSVLEDYSDIGMEVKKDNYSGIGREVTPVIPELIKAPPATFIDRIKSFFTDPEKDIAKAQNVYALSEVTGLQLKDVYNNYDLLRRSSKVTGITPDLERREYMAIAMTPFIAAAAVANPIGTTAGLIAYAALDKAIPTDEMVKKIETGMGGELSDTTKTTIDLLDFIGKGLIVGGVFKQAPKLAEGFMKRKLVEYNLAKDITLSKDQVRDIFQTGKLTTAEEQSLFGSLNLSGNELKASLQEGVKITIPAEKLTTLVDKPIWAKIKSIVGAESKPKIVSELAGQPKKAIAGLIDQVEAPKTPVLGPNKPIQAPITPKAIPEGLPLAIRLKSGEIITDATAKLHSDIVTAKGINPDDVVDVGIEVKGEYQATKIPDSKGGAPLESLPEVPEGLMEKVKGMVDQAQFPPPPKGRGEIVPPEMNFGTWKDKNALSLSRETLERNIEDVAGKDAPEVKEFITDPIKKNETARAEWITEKRQVISGKMQELGIKYKSKESALVMRYGENRMTLGELKKEAPENWESIAKGSDYFRNLYDEMLDDINLVRSKYGYDPIPKRQDYFRHYQEMGNVIQSVGLIFREEDLPTGIAGLTGIFKPGKPFTTAELKRKGGAFTEDAIGAMDNYIDAISKQLFHIDSVQRARVLDKYIRTQSEVNEDVKLPNFAANLNEYANLIAGKKATFDRAFEGLFGRPLYGVVNFLKKRTGANMIGANISSALMNFIPFTQSLSTTKPQSAMKGLMEAIITPFNKTHFEIDGVKSDLFTRRYPVNQMAFNWLGKIEESANSSFRLVDQFAAKSILAGKYYEGIDMGLSPEKAMKQADSYTAKIIADRAWGQLPNLMGSKTLGMITQFQTEVNNMFSNILKDIPRQYKGDTKKVFNAFATFAVLSFLFNEAYEKTLGRRPTIDPIYAVLTLLGMSSLGKDQPTGKRIWRTIVDVGGNVPFGNLVVQGGRFPISAGIPDINKVLTSETGSEKAKELMKPLYYFAMPLAGGQVKKTVEGTTDVLKGKSTTPKGKTRYKIEQDFSNFMRGFLFGKNAFPEARKHYENQGIKKKDKF